MRRRTLPEQYVPPVDLTPMIDCVFLLLIFFILTSRITPDERQIATLLPTEAAGKLSPPILALPTTVFAIMPNGIPINASRADCLRIVAALRSGMSQPLVALRIGGGDPLVIDPQRLLGTTEEQTAAVDAIHAWVALRLAEREDGTASRAAAPTIEIRCFSGLPWMVALVAYDAIRAFERDQGAPIADSPLALAGARTVTFAATPLRNWSADAEARELQDLAQVR